MDRLEASKRLTETIKETLGLSSYTNNYRFYFDPETGKRKENKDKETDIYVVYGETPGGTPQLRFVHYIPEKWIEEYSIKLNVKKEKKYGYFIKQEYYTWTRQEEKKERETRLECTYDDARTVTKEVIDRLCDKIKQILLSPDVIFLSKKDIMEQIYHEANKIFLLRDEIAEMLKYKGRKLQQDTVVFEFKTYNDSDSETVRRYNISMDEVSGRHIKLTHDGRFEEDRIDFVTREENFVVDIYRDEKYIYKVGIETEKKTAIKYRQEVGERTDFLPVLIPEVLTAEFEKEFRGIQQRLEEIKQTGKQVWRQAVIVNRLEHNAGPEKRLNI